MDKIYKRFILFLFICIGIRSFAVYLAKVSNIFHLKILGYLYLLFGLGIISIYIFDLRKFGNEVFGEKIWWNDFRPLFGLIWLTFSYLAITGQTKIAWKILLLDVIFGLVIFFMHHFTTLI